MNRGFGYIGGVRKTGRSRARSTSGEVPADPTSDLSLSRWVALYAWESLGLAVRGQGQNRPYGLIYVDRIKAHTLVGVEHQQIRDPE